VARALECPACGARHPVDGREPASEFRCERCGQKLLVPAAATAAASTTNAPASSPAPPPRRGATSAAASTAGTVTVTLPATGEGSKKPPVDGRTSAQPPPAAKRRAAWYWRLLAWIVAVPLGFVIAVWPSYEFGLISKDDVLDIFVGSGADRYLRLAAVTAIWAVVTALLVQLFVEGGRWLAARRRARRRPPRPRATPMPTPGPS
jgi:hypothetical protein